MSHKASEEERCADAKKFQRIDDAFRASMYMRFGDAERALEWVQRAYVTHDPNVYGLISPMWDPMRADPRFVDLLRRLHLPVR